MPRSIVGIVMDSAHSPLGNATVLIREPRREVRTSDRGIFTIKDLDPGTYNIIVRRIGYEFVMQEYIVPDTGGVARFCLFAEVKALAAMITSVPRGGLSGVIGDTTYGTVAGAEVRAMGQGRWILSDSGGGFYLPLEKGTYAIQVKKKGYGTQLLSVTIPADSGRRIAVWLGSRQRNANAYAEAIEGLRVTILRTPAHRFHQISAEDLAKTDWNLTQIVRAKGGEPLSDDCEAGIAGRPGFAMPIYMFNKEEIAMITVVGGPIRNSARGGGARGRGAAVGPASKCSLGVTVWLKP